jgi:hypothetical protein
MSWVEAAASGHDGDHRLAEHWAHGLDITWPLGIPFPDTDRLRHIAWLAHRAACRTRFALAKAATPDVACDLTAWDEPLAVRARDADSVIQWPGF